MSKSKILKRITKHIIKSGFFSKLIIQLIYTYAKFVKLTTQWEIKGLDKCYKTWEQNGSIILIGWHGRAMMIPLFWNHTYHINALVSLHQDGRLIAGYLEKVGIHTIGGSSTNGAKAAAMALMRSLKRNESIAIIPDGPLGPSMRMSMSPLYYAQKTGKPIIGATYSVKNSKIISKSWDDMMVPFPFSKGVCYLTEPFYIPHDATPEDLERYRLRLETSLNQLSFNADTAVGISPVQPRNHIKNKRHTKL